MKNSILTKMQKTWAGRTLARLVGEDAGAVMMEYVILAVLIAAAAVVAIAYFGRTIVSEANVATTAMAEGGIAAAEVQKTVKQNTKTKQQGAVTENKKFTDASFDAESRQ